MTVSKTVEATLFSLNRMVGRFIPWQLKDFLAKRLFPRGAAKPKMLTVDILGSCNLRCPSCPVGTMGQINPTGLMDIGLFKEIVHKARKEHDVRVVALHNWTEPFLHPELPDFIRVVKNSGLVCAISSNLNIERNIKEVIKAAPDFFRISLSAFAQESYATTHLGGNIERVKRNMRIASEALSRAGKWRTRVTVFYHKYLHNTNEMKKMRCYTRELGFEWMEEWAYYMPLEKVFQLIDGHLSPEEHSFVEDRLALPILDAIVASKKIMGHDRCTLLEDQIVLDYQGNVNLCCVVYELNKNRLGSFLSMHEEELNKAKANHPTCYRCGRHKLHLYFNYFDVPELKQAYDNLARAKMQRRTIGSV